MALVAVLPIPVIGVMQYFKRKNNGLPVDLRDAASKIIISIIIIKSVQTDYSQVYI